MYHRHKHLNEKGFTLLEVLIVLGILSYLLVQAFQVLNFNFELMDKELSKKDTRDEYRMFTSFMIQDVMLSEDVTVYQGDGYEVLTYTNIDGESETIEFNHENGIFQNIDGERKLIVSGEKVDEVEPMVKLENEKVSFNFYSKEINTRLSLTISRRVLE